MPQDQPSKPKPIFSLIAICLLLFFGVNISSTLYRSLQNKQLLQAVKQDVANLQKKKDRLQKQLNYQKTNQFVEQQARNNLDMAKPNEVVVIFPQRPPVLGASTSQGQKGSNTLGIRVGNIGAWEKLFWP